MNGNQVRITHSSKAAIVALFADAILTIFSLIPLNSLVAVEHPYAFTLYIFSIAVFGLSFAWHVYGFRLLATLVNSRVLASTAVIFSLCILAMCTLWGVSIFVKGFDAILLLSRVIYSTLGSFFYLQMFTIQQRIPASTLPCTISGALWLSVLCATIAFGFVTGGNMNIEPVRLYLSIVELTAIASSGLLLRVVVSSKFVSH